MLDFEKKQFEQWQAEHAFEKIIHYVDLLKEPSYEHLGQKAAALNNLRRYYEAKTLLESIYPEGKNDSMWYYRYAYLQMQFEEYDKSCDTLKRALAIDPHNGNAWYLLSMLYEYYLNDSQLAQQAHQKAIENQVNIEYLSDDEFKVNQQFNRQHQFLYEKLTLTDALKTMIADAFQQMIYLLEHHVTTYDQLPDIIQALANTLKQQFKHEEQRFSERNRVVIEEDLVYVLDWFGVSYLYIETLCALYRFEAFPNQPYHLKSEHLMYLLDNSDSHFEGKVITLFNQLADEEKTLDYYLLAIETYIEEENASCAKELLEECRQAGQTHDFWWQLYGFLCLLEDNQEEALEAFEQSLALNRDNAESWMGLEQLYADYFGDMTKADYARTQWKLLIDEDE